MAEPLIAVAEARRRLLAMATPVATETLAIGAASGRWTAAPVTARRTQPARDLSAMDGYAVRFGDLPGPFRVVGESAAGRPSGVTVGPGEAVRIFTGAAVPDGADSIVIQEEVARESDLARLTGEGPSAIGRHIRRRGLDFSAGDVVVPAGERLTPARIAVAATAGVDAISVRRRIRVATAATGDELVRPGMPVGDGQLPESNGIMIAAQLADLPVDIVDLGILPDRLDVLADAFHTVDADVLVTTGGASVGDHDLVRPALKAAGADIDFWRIALRPGKPMMAGRLGRMIALGLPGNPVSAFVTTHIFLRPLIGKLSGAHDPCPLRLRVPLAEALPANDHREDYLRARLIDGCAVPFTFQDSSMLLTLASSACLIVREPHAPAAAKGEMVSIISLA